MVDEVINTHMIEANSAIPRTSLSGMLLKRTFDIVMSFLGLLVLSPLFLVIAILIKREGPGPVFYRGPRVGRDGKRFGILKFRTMFERLESYQGARVTAKDDPRVTPLGHWLRDTKINELPQLWNVLIGEMSLVGPRPEDPKLAESWPADVRNEVLSISPGITSPASVLYRDEEQLLLPDKLLETYFGNILPSKLRLDQLYVRHHSFLMDLDVIFWTIISLLPGRINDQVHEESLFWGPWARLFRRYLSWFILDAMTAFGAFALTGILWRLGQPLDVGWLPSLGVVLSFSLLFSLIGAMAGVQKIVWTKARAEDVLDLIPSTTLAGIIIAGIDFYLGIFPFGMILAATFLSFAGFVLVRYRQRILTGAMSRWLTWRRDENLLRERVLIIGSGDAGRMAAWIIENSREARALKVVGYIDDDLFKQQTRLGGISVLGQRDDIPRLARQYDVGLIVYAIHDIAEVECKAILRICKKTSARLVILPNVLGMFQAKKPANSSKTFVEGLQYGLDYGLISQQQVTEWMARIEEDLTREDYKSALADVRQIKNDLHSLEKSGEAL